MKTIVLIGLAAACLAAWIVPPFLNRDSQSPTVVEIVQSSPENLGKVAVNSEAAREVTLRNVSDRAVDLGIEMLSCGCLDASFGRARINPGEESTFIMKTTVVAERGQQPMAALLRATTPGHEAPPQLVRVNLVYEAAVAYFVYPLRVVIHHRVGETGIAEVVIAPQLREWIGVLDARIDGEGLSVAVGAPVTTAKGHGATLRVHSSISRAGAFESRLFVRTDSDEHPEFSLPVFVRVYPTGGAAAPAIVLHSTDGAGAIEDVLCIQSDWLPEGIEPNQVTVSIVDPPPGLRSRWRDGPTGRELVIRCDFAVVSPPFGEATIALRDASGADLAAIPVVWISDLHLLQCEGGVR